MEPTYATSVFATVFMRPKEGEKEKRKGIELDISIGGLDGTERQTDYSESGKVFFPFLWYAHTRAKHTHTHTHTHILLS